MEEISRSKTNTTIRNWNEWVDSEGRLHRKVITETITAPENVKQASVPNQPVFPDFRFDPMRLWFPTPQIIESKDFFGDNPREKPLLSRENIKAGIEAAQKFLKESGIKLEDLFKSEKKSEKESESKEEGTPNIVGERNKPNPKDLKSKKPTKKKEVIKMAKKPQKKVKKVEEDEEDEDEDEDED